MVMRRNSQLVFRTVSPTQGAAATTTIALHDANGGLNDLLPLVASWAPDGRVIAPEAARGVYIGMDIVAHTWYGGADIEGPEPISFVDSLAQLERFVVDEAERWADAKFLLFGWGQGAVLAITLAQVVPEMLSGVIAVGGGSPRALERLVSRDVLRAMDGLPFLLIDDPERKQSAERTARELLANGAVVSTAYVSALRRLDDRVAPIVQSWLKNSTVGGQVRP